jgi:tetratricopeptide repeat protein
MMKYIGGAAVLLALLLPGFVAGADKKDREPFYRRYLVAGNALDEKILDQEKRVQADPKSADLRNDFGNLLAARRFPKEAREQYEIAMKLDAHHFLAPYNLGLLYETLGETRRAISAYEKSVDRNRGFPPSRFRLGRLYEKQGSQSRAIEQYARALQIDPTMRDPHRNPLIVDTRLLDRVSVQNYPRDLAVASMAADAAYADRDRLRKVPLDRSLSSGDVQPPSPESPVTTTVPVVGPTPVRVIAPSSPARRPPPAPVRAAPPPSLVPTPEFDVAPPQDAPPLPTPDPSGGRPPYIGGPRPVPGAPGAPPTPVPTPEN